MSLGGLSKRYDFFGDRCRGYDMRGSSVVKTAVSQAPRDKKAYNRKLVNGLSECILHVGWI
jgi:hypothetical protein